MPRITDHGKIIAFDLEDRRGRCIQCCTPASTNNPLIRIVREVRIRHEVTWEVLAVGRDTIQRCYIACP